MKKIFTLVLSLTALSGFSAYALDYTLLTAPNDVLAHSTETVAGARDAFEAVLNNEAATDEEKTTAMQDYEKKSNPKPGYAYDMTFMLSYTSVTETNKGAYTQARLAEAWSCDISGITLGQDDALKVQSTDKAGIYMRLYNNSTPSPLQAEESYGKFALYQTVELAAGCYQLEARAFLAGLASAATLSAGDAADSEPIIGGGVLKPYEARFSMADASEIKLGFKRNSKAGKPTTIAFNDMCLYKISDIVEIKDDASGPLAPAENATVQLSRSFSADEYSPICLPFVVENWREVFDDLLIWNNYADGELSFVTLGGKNTQARKPYLAKMKENISAENYLTFSGVNIESGNAGAWTKSVAEGETPFPVKMQGNWAAGTIPAGCYYLDGDAWTLSDGTAPVKGFSAYIDASGLETRPGHLPMVVNKGNTSLIGMPSLDEAESLVTVYNLQGMAVRREVVKANALMGLPSGIYIVNGKKIVKY